MISCRDTDSKVPADVGVSDIFFDYRVTGEDGMDKLTVLLQFRYDDEEGDAVSLSS